MSNKKTAEKKDNDYDVVYLDAKKLVFKRKDNKLQLKKDKKLYENIKLRRAFPLSNEDMYISVLDDDKKDDKELGVIKDINSLDEETMFVVREYLDEEYYMPRINQIFSIKKDKEEKNRYLITMQTDKGLKRALSHNINKYLRKIDTGKYIFEDDLHNMYMIEDLFRMDIKSRQIIEPYLSE